MFDGFWNNDFGAGAEVMDMDRGKGMVSAGERGKDIKSQLSKSTTLATLKSVIERQSPHRSLLEWPSVRTIVIHIHNPGVFSLICSLSHVLTTVLIQDVKPTPWCKLQDLQLPLRRTSARTWKAMLHSVPRDMVAGDKAFAKCSTLLDCKVMPHTLARTIATCNTGSPSIVNSE